MFIIASCIVLDYARQVASHARLLHATSHCSTCCCTRAPFRAYDVGVSTSQCEAGSSCNTTGAQPLTSNVICRHSNGCDPSLGMKAEEAELQDEEMLVGDLDMSDHPEDGDSDIKDVAAILIKLQVTSAL